MHKALHYDMDCEERIEALSGPRWKGVSDYFPPFCLHFYLLIQLSLLLFFGACLSHISLGTYAGHRKQEVSRSC